MLKISEWQYPLYQPADRTAYKFFLSLLKKKKYPKLIGSSADINQMIRLITAGQKMKDYRQFRNIILTELKKPVINAAAILFKFKDFKIPAGVAKSWAIFYQDKKLCLVIDKFLIKKNQFKGANSQAVEFIVRFLLSQLLYDWRGPLLAILLECLKAKSVAFAKLNRFLKIWNPS